MAETGTAERYEIDITSNELLQEIQELKQKNISLSELTEEQFQAIHFARQEPMLVWDIISDWFNKKHNIKLSRRALADRYEKALKEHRKTTADFKPCKIKTMKEIGVEMVENAANQIRVDKA